MNIVDEAGSREFAYAATALSQHVKFWSIRGCGDLGNKVKANNS
jgi:hypothetical protein